VTDRTCDGFDAMGFSDALVSSDEKPLLKVSSDTDLPPCATVSNSRPILFDSNGSEDITSQLLQSSSRDDKEDVLLLDAGDEEASFLQVPCLIPESVTPSSSSLPQNGGQQNSSTIGVAVDGSMEKSVESQPFDFVNDVMKSAGPNLSNKSAILRSVPAVRGQELAAAEFGSSKS